jgi:hypothetical protein
MFRGLGVAVAIGVVTSLAAPAGAARVSQESYKFDGVMAEAFWTADEEPALGTPHVVAIMGADAMTVHKVPGAKPDRTRQPAVLAMGVMTANGPQEWWCISEADAYAFVVADDLSAATLGMDCLAEIYAVDPTTGEEVPTGAQLPLSAWAEWTAVGPLESQRTHSRTDVGGSWTLDIGRRSARPAVAHLTVAGPDGIVFDAQLAEASLESGRGFTLTHE